MQIIKEIAEFFLLALSLGTVFFSFLAKTNWTGGGFIKVLAGVCSGSLVIYFITSLTHRPVSSMEFLIGGLVLIFFGLTFFLHKDDKTVLLWIFYGLQVLGLSYLGYALMERSFESFIHFLLASSFIGVINYAMILGHWYLVTPKMSEGPLLNAVNIIWVIIFIKFFYSIYILMQNPTFLSQGTDLGGGYMFNWIMVSMRYLWGYLAIVILNIFAYKLVKMRSIQSATGILYVMVFFIFVGEMTSSYLFYKHGLAL